MVEYQIIFVPYEKHATVYYSMYDSPYGEVMLLATDKGICGLHFLNQPLAYYLHLATKKFGIVPVHAPAHTQHWWQSTQQATNPLPLVIQGTPFQQEVWKALCDIPVGATCSYQILARQLGLPQGARAVGNAIAQNFIAWLIPCHRVVRQHGQLGGYRWGVPRKIALLEYERAFRYRQGPPATGEHYALLSTASNL